MDTKDKVVTLFDDIPDLSNILEKLGLAPTIPDLSDSLHILENDPGDLACITKEAPLKELKINSPVESNPERVQYCMKGENYENVTEYLSHLNIAECSNILAKNEGTDFIKVEPNSVTEKALQEGSILDKQVESIPNKQVKIEDEYAYIIPCCSSTNIKTNSEDLLQVLVKEGNKDNIKVEPLSDSDDEDELTNSILERGGPERIRRLIPRRPQNERINKSSSRNIHTAQRQGHTSPNVDIANIDQQRLRFLSSGHIVQNNYVLPVSSTQPVLANYFQHFNSASSPESGYDTSQSSGVNSPSPPDFTKCLTSPGISEEEILDNIIEVENYLKPSGSQSVNLNVPVLGDDNGDYIEQVKNFLKRPVSSVPSIFSQTILNGKASGPQAVTTDSLKPSGSQFGYLNIPVLDDDNSGYFEQGNNFLKENVSSVSSIYSPTGHTDEGSSSGADSLADVTVPDLTSKTSNERIVQPQLRKLRPKIGGEMAKYQLHLSESFDDEKYIEEQMKLFRKIKEQERSKEEIKVIDFEEGEREQEKLKRTNLHTAVLNSNIEKVYCLIEALKRFQIPLFDINHRDDSNKTALDYAVKKNNSLITNYLEENDAVRGIDMKTCKELKGI